MIILTVGTRSKKANNFSRPSVSKRFLTIMYTKIIARRTIATNVILIIRAPVQGRIETIESNANNITGVPMKKPIKDRMYFPWLTGGFRKLMFVLICYTKSPTQVETEVSHTSFPIWLDTATLCWVFYLCLDLFHHASKLV